MAGVSDLPGEQLDPFTAAEAAEAAAAAPAGRAGHVARHRGRGDLQHMDLVAQVLQTAEAPGYLVEDTAAGTGVWRASKPLDPHRELPGLEQAQHDETAMVIQLLGRGWLHRSTRTRTRTAHLRGQSSGRRHIDVEVHALSAPTPARHSLARWSALAAVPTQRPDPDPS